MADYITFFEVWISDQLYIYRKKQYLMKTKLFIQE